MATGEFVFLNESHRAGLNSMRSCIGCGLIRPKKDWFGEEGDSEVMDCPNCHFHESNIYNFTSASFTGCLAIFQNEHSWCALWERHHHCMPGLYALDNQGEVTKEIIEHLQNHQRPLPEWAERKKKALEIEEDSD